MKIGILGGSFNPIHIGHAMLANYISQYTDLDQLWLMVSPQNPLKSDLPQEYDAHRIRMAQMVADVCDNVSVCGLEFTMPRPSYTVDTLRVLSEKFPQHKFVLVIGADNWCNFEKWKDYQTIIDNYEIYIFRRTGSEIVIPEQYSNTVKVIDAPVVDISSTFIRKQLKECKNMNFFLPHNVYRYILENKLYI